MEIFFQERKAPCHIGTKFGVKNVLEPPLFGRDIQNTFYILRSLKAHAIFSGISGYQSLFDRVPTVNCCSRVNLQ